MSRRSTGSLLVIALCVAALWAFAGPPFLAAPPSQQSTAALRGADCAAPGRGPGSDDRSDAGHGPRGEPGLR
eukprot:CAMPEP_0183564624 /NCGR_PEP_ID=MMETSP0371-20130417/106083_1 /TAXON_ID=268820 /ORGANISM="Peridinium aciculiferum, Strain PAER-2" /LENGTH=71 /DNA_ID=CAMNT_0025773675 /DNA_START=1 /DNA_END=213 /DNA_ORIENTATION=+